MPEQEPIPPPPQPSPAPEAGPILDRSTFEHRRRDCLYSVDRWHHLLYARKARQFCAFLRDAVDHFGGAWILFAIVYSIAHAILTPIPAIGLFFGVLLWIIWAWFT